MIEAKDDPSAPRFARQIIRNYLYLPRDVINNYSEMFVRLPQHKSQNRHQPYQHKLTPSAHRIVFGLDLREAVRLRVIEAKDDPSAPRFARQIIRNYSQTSLLVVNISKIHFSSHFHDHYIISDLFHQ